MTGPPADGSLELCDGANRLRFRRRLRQRPEAVWKALVEPEQLEAWFPSTIEGARAEGAELRFVFPMEGAPVIGGRLLIYDPPRTLAFTWGEDTLRFDLVADGDGTLLELVDTFPELGKGTCDAAGWHVCLDMLADALAGTRRDDSGSSWAAIAPHYRQKFPPEASTIGPPDWHPDAD